MHFTIRADGGPEIGYGHLIRSNAIGEEFLKRGHEITVATTTPNIVQSVFNNSANITELPSRDDPGPFLDWLATNVPDLVFTDAYPVDTKYQRILREKVSLTVLQDDARHAICADLFTNGNLYASDIDYEFVGPDPKTCLGTDYVLLRREIRELAQKEPPWRDEPERAIIIMGGSDIENLTPTVVRAFDGFDIHVDAIIGPGVSKRKEKAVRSTARKTSTEVSVMRYPDDLPERIFQADIAVSTSSSTTYELLALGTPIVSVPVADNQEKIAEALRKRDAAVIVERTADERIFQNAIEMYMSNKPLRKKRQKLGCELVDGEGVNRVIEELKTVIEN